MTDASKRCYSKAVVTIPEYSYLHQYLDRVSIGIQNFTNRPVGIKPKTTIAAIPAGNVVPPMLAPRVNIKSASATSCNSVLSQIKSHSDQSILRGKLNIFPE